MAITSISGVGGIQAGQNIASASNRLQAVISSIVSGQSDNTDVSEATQLQGQTSGLKQALTNLAQASSLTEVAGGGVEQIQGALTQLQTLAQQATSPTLNAADQADLNQEFSTTLNTINNIVSSTQFNGQSPLNGSLSGSGALSLDSLLGVGNSGGDTLSIGNLGTSSLLPGVGNISTTANATQALSVVNNALSQVTSTNANIGAFEQTLNFASASVGSAIINQQAASAALSDTDIPSATTQESQDTVQFDAAIALAAQGNNLTPALLKLVG